MRTVDDYRLYRHIESVHKLKKNPQTVTTTLFLSEGTKMVAGNFTPTEDMVFGDANIAAIALYFLMFSVGLTTNTLSLYKLVTARLKLKDRSRMTLLLIHLAVADMLVRCPQHRATLSISCHETLGVAAADTL